MSFKTTGKKTASELIRNGNCLLKGAFVTTDGNNNATLTIYDNNGASGKIARQFVVPAAQRYGGFYYREGIQIDNAMYCVISGTGAAYWIDWLIYE